jgi:hypothetical protein
MIREINHDLLAAEKSLVHDFAEDKTKKSTIYLHFVFRKPHLADWVKLWCMMCMCILQFFTLPLLAGYYH